MRAKRAHRLFAESRHDAMIFLGLLAGYLTLLGAGFGIVFLMLRGAGRINLLESCCLAWLFGAGGVSLLLWIFGLFSSGVILVAAVTACCGGLAFAGWRATSQSRPTLYFPRPGSLWEWMLLSILLVQIAFIFWLSLQRTLGWDGLIMWESKARFAFLNHNVLPAHYYHSGRDLTHPEYPLGVPFTELWLYIWMGEAHQLWIKTVFATFYAVGVALLAMIVTRLTAHQWLGYLAAVLFFFVPHETVGTGSATIGYVDFPLSVFYLTAVGYLLLALKSSSKYDFRIYAASLALLPWFKREGAILWLIAAMAGAAIFLIRRQPRWLVALCPGALLIFGWAAYLRFVGADIPQEFAPVNVRLFLQNAGRLVPTWRALLLDASSPAAWGIFWVLAAVAIVYLAGRLRKLESATLLWASLVPIVAYSSIYIFSVSEDYLVHIKLSLPRLLMHVVPVMWIAVASAFATPCRLRNSSDPALADLRES
jgi:hypothetical protein